MVPGKIVGKVVGGGLKVVALSMITGIVVGAIIWEHKGPAIKTWLQERGLACPFCAQNASSAKEAKDA